VKRFFLLLACLIFSGTAHAQSVQTAYAGGNPIVLSVPVTASIAVRCGSGAGELPAGNFNKDDFDRSGFSAQFDFALNCNGPSRVAISSTNGGLLTNAAVSPGYRNKADYEVTLHLRASDGTSAQATCAASTMANGGSCSYAGTASTTRGLQLSSFAFNQAGSYVRISAPAQVLSASPLVQGSYSDVLRVTVSPAL
jgi:hypothetical protein